MNINYSDFIQITDDLFTQDYCEQVCDFYQNCIDKKLVVGGSEESGMPKSKRDDTCVHIPHGLPSVCFPSEWVQLYFENVTNLITQYNEEYSIDHTLASYDWKIHKVKAGQGYHIFHDEIGNRQGNAHERFLTYMTYVKSPDAGGETEFLFQSQRVEPKLGRTIIWPSHFTHKHRGNPVLEGEKIYITGWYHLQ